MKKIALSLQVKKTAQQDAGEYEKKVFSSHYGTHFDVMDKEFPLDYSELDGVVFDVSAVGQ